MIREYALVSPAGEILSHDFLDEEFVVAPEDLAHGKPRYLPVEQAEAPACDPAVEVLQGPFETVEADRVVVAYTVRAKTPEEVEALRAAKREAISAAFAARAFAPVAHTVGQAAKVWDADPEARARIAGVLQLMAAGAMATTRSWTASGELTPTAVTQDDLLAIAAAIAAREDALFVVKKAKEAELAGLGTAAEIATFDPAAGWGA